MKRDCISVKFSTLFYKLGKFISIHKVSFIAIPICMTTILCIGIVFLEYESDIEYLYAPKNAPAFDELSEFDSTYIQDDENYFSSARMLNLEGYLQIHLSARELPENVISEAFFESAWTLNNFVENFEVNSDDVSFKYVDICSRWNGSCLGNDALKLYSEKNYTIENSLISYPTQIAADGSVYSFVQQFGSVTLINDTYIKESKAVLLSYYVQSQDEEMLERGVLWQNELKDALLEYNDPMLSIELQTSQTLDQELEESITSITKLFTITYTVLSLLSCSWAIMLDWVRAKPWIPLAGMSAAAMGIG